MIERRHPFTSTPVPARAARVVTFTELARAFGIPKDAPMSVRLDGPNLVLEYETQPRTSDFYMSRRQA